MEYEDRIVIYIDVLGFGDFINHSQNSRLSPGKKVKDTLRYLQMLQGFLDKTPQNDPLCLCSTKQVTCFSDLVVISICTSEIEFFDQELRDIIVLIYNSILNGFLLRGSIVYGKLI